MCTCDGVVVVVEATTCRYRGHELYKSALRPPPYIMMNQVKARLFLHRQHTHTTAPNTHSEVSYPSHRIVPSHRPTFPLIGAVSGVDEEETVDIVVLGRAQDIHTVPPLPACIQGICVHSMRHILMLVIVNYTYLHTHADTVLFKSLHLNPQVY